MIEPATDRRKETTPLVDVVVISYQQARFLPALLDGLLAQTLSEWRAVVVDDGSKDNSEQILANYSAREPRIAYVRQSNSGPAAARNRGLAFFPAAQAARYITFVDGDDVLGPTFLAELSQYLDSVPHAVAVGCGFDVIDETGRLTGPGRRTRRAPKWRLPLDIPATQHLTPFVSFYCGTGQGPFYLYRRAVVEKTKGWTSEFWPHEDTDFATQVALKGEMHMLNQRLYLKREHAQNITKATGDNKTAHHTPDAYSRFRYRWCRWQAKDQREERLLADAHRYYMTWFSPFRDLTVAARAYRSLLLTGQLRHLRWGSYLTWRALSHFLRYHILRLSPDRTKDAQRFAPRPQ